MVLNYSHWNVTNIGVGDSDGCEEGVCKTWCSPSAALIDDGLGRQCDLNVFDCKTIFVVALLQVTRWLHVRLNFTYYIWLYEWGRVSDSCPVMTCFRLDRYIISIKYFLIHVFISLSLSVVGRQSSVYTVICHILDFARVHLLLSIGMFW